MSDSSVTLVDLDASPKEAERLAEALRDWLVEQRIISAETSDCVLGSDEGHRPGEQLAHALDKPEDAESSDLRRLMTNGVAFQVGRTVFDAGDSGAELRCAKNPLPRRTRRRLDGGGGCVGRRRRRNHLCLPPLRARGAPG